VNGEQFCEFVKLAKLGDEQSLERLSALVRPRLCSYVYRVTLNRDIIDDLAQETLLEMVKSLHHLRDNDRFWPWLYRIALSKIQQHFAAQKRQPAVPSSTIADDFFTNQSPPSEDDSLRILMRQELSHKMLSAIGQLRPKHRAVLSLRCFEQMPYTEIALALECNELNARIAFFRAKQALKKLLVHRGLDKGTLLMCLGLFGQLTAPSDAALNLFEQLTAPAGTEAGPIAPGSGASATGAGAIPPGPGSGLPVASAITKVGMIAGLIGAAGSKLGMAVIALLAGLGAVSTLTLLSAGLPDRENVTAIYYIEQSKSNDPAIASLSKGAYEQWYYFPEGIDGPMFKRMQRWDSKQQQKLCAWLENGTGNYYYDSGKKEILLTNHHLFRSNLRVRRLPTDRSAFIDFLNQVEGPVPGIEHRRDAGTGLLIERFDDRFVDARHFRTNYVYNTLEEEVFHFENWISGVPIRDERDEMHRRGWTFFRIEGRLGNRNVHGQGRLPFFYHAGRDHPPWLTIAVDDGIRIMDTSQGAVIIRSDASRPVAYPAGSFFKGFSRPWT